MISNIKWHCLLLCFVNINHGASSNPITLRILQLEYDVLEYVVIECLAQGECEKMKDDSLNLSHWHHFGVICMLSNMYYFTVKFTRWVVKIIVFFVFVSYI